MADDIEFDNIIRGLEAEMDESGMAYQAYVAGAQEIWEQQTDEARARYAHLMEFVGAIFRDFEAAMHRAHTTLPDATVTLKQVEEIIAQQTKGFEHLAAGGEPKDIEEAMGHVDIMDQVHEAYKAKQERAKRIAVGTKVRLISWDSSSQTYEQVAPPIGVTGTVTEVGESGDMWSVDFGPEYPAPMVYRLMGIAGWLVFGHEIEVVSE